MSKLAELIAANRTGKMSRELEHLASVCAIVEDIAVIRTGDCTEYKIGVSFGAHVHVREDAMSDLNMAIQRVKQSVIEAVFGEFRQDLRDMHRLLWEQNYRDAAAQLEEIERKMFSL